MKMRVMLAVSAAVALAGCQGDNREDVLANGTAEANMVVDNGDAGNNVAAQVIAMNDAQRNVVFIRALLDAGLPCDHVDSSERMPDQDGAPLWRANCGGQGSHMITITPDGTAKIVSRSDR
jgi:hypothetical protein